MRVQRLLLPESLTDSKGVGEVTIVGHARRRMEFLWKDLNVLHGLAPPLSGAKLFIKGAPAQGKIAAIKGNQAAHVNFLSGLQTNIKEIIKKEDMVNKKKKRKISLLCSFQQDASFKVKDIFDIARNYGARRQATHEFEADVNVVDGGMENALRNKKVISVLKRIFQGEMEIEDAFDAIKNKVAKYFRQAVEMIPIVQKKIQRYNTLMEKLARINREQNPNGGRVLSHKEHKSKQKLQQAINSIVKSLKNGNTPGCGRIKPVQYNSRLQKLPRWKEICEKQYLGTIKAFNNIRLTFEEKKKMLAFHGGL